MRLGRGKITRKTLERYRELIASGMSAAKACARLGIHADSMVTLRRLGQAAAEKRQKGLPLSRKEALGLAAYVAHEEGKAEFEETQLRLIRLSAGSGDWRAAAWLLERRFPDDWSLASRIRVTSQHLSDAELMEMSDEALYAALSKAADEGEGGGE